MSAIPRAEADSLVKAIMSHGLLNRQLSSICQLNGLQTSGVKAHLQNRIKGLILETIDQGDLPRFRQVQSSVNTVAQSMQRERAPSNKPTYSQTTMGGSSNQRHQHGYGAGAGYYPGTSNGYGSHVSHSHSSHGPHGRGGTSQSAPQTSIQYKPSPFYEVKNSVGPVKTCDVMNQHRNMVSVKIRLNDHPSLQQCLTDKSMRIMVLCANDKHGPQDISFPHQSEIKVNGGDIKANLRGLKNRPGSTRPVDITDSLRLRPSNYENSVDLVYALTQKQFYVGVYLCKTTSVAELVTKIDTGKRMTKASVVQEILRKAADEDIVFTSETVSLKCPLSFMRIQVPCRSNLCIHNQCFDATSYLQLQEQGPQWLCPVCNKSATFDRLVVDEYAKDILANTSSDQDQVTIEPNAEWHRVGSTPQPKAAGNRFEQSYANGATIDDDDDLEISEVNVVRGRKVETPVRSSLNMATPDSVSASSAARQASSSTPRGVSGKRPAASQDVIDLTLSSDEDDGPPPKKKQHIDTGLPLPRLY